ERVPGLHDLWPTLMLAGAGSGIGVAVGAGFRERTLIYQALPSPTPESSTPRPNAGYPPPTGSLPAPFREAYRVFSTEQAARELAGDLVRETQGGNRGTEATP
ncbi:MAG: hypothetical protein AAB289_03955, partial [Chloroflexota bacterium]